MKKKIIQKSNLIVSNSGELLATNDNKKYFYIHGFCWTKLNSSIEPFQKIEDNMILFEMETREDSSTNESEQGETNQPYILDFNDLFSDCMSVGIYTVILIIVFILAFVNK